MSLKADSLHPHFRRIGGTYQLDIRTWRDLEKVLVLEEAKWMATSAPIDGLAANTQFLQMVDTDHNGRIRVDEIRHAISWTLHVLRDRTGIDRREDAVNLAAIDVSHEEGRALKSTAERILQNLGLADRTHIRAEQLTDRKKLVRSSISNGDGVICPENALSTELAEAMREIMRAVGSERDINGKDGLTLKLLDLFVTEAKAFLGWCERAALGPGQSSSEIMPLGEQTGPACEANDLVAEKLDQYFALCRLKRVAPDWFEARTDKQNARELPGEVGEIEDMVRKTPLATPVPEERLDLDAVVHPAFVRKLAAFRSGVLEPLGYGKNGVLTHDDWQAVKDIFVPYRAWLAEKKGIRVAPMGADRLRHLLTGPVEAELRRLIQADLAIAEELAQAHKVIQLCHYQQGLLDLVNNFVSFPDLYRTDKTALFEMGTLIMDGRRFQFSVRVADPKAHAAIAQESRIFLLYTQLTRADAKESFYIVTAVTAGGQGNLTLAKRGLFQTTDGRYWDARVVHIVERPISLWEAVKHPFRNIGSFLGAKFEKLSGAGERKLQTALDKRLESLETSIETSIESASEADLKAVAEPAASRDTGTTPPRKDPAEQGGGGVRDVFMNGSVAVAAIGSAFAFVTKTLSEVRPMNILIAVIVGISLIIVPTLITGALSLRRRDMAAILEASGWAINAKMRLTTALSKVFTQTPGLPKKAKVAK